MLQHFAAAADLRHVYYETADVRYRTAKKRLISEWLLTCVLWYSNSSMSAVIFIRVWLNLNFLGRFSKNTQKSNFMKIPPVEA